MMPTPKNYRLLRRIGRGELVRHFEHEDLHTMVENELPALIDPATIAELKADARSGLDALAAAIAEHAPPIKRRG
jgi:hypothetical protein